MARFLLLGSGVLQKNVLRAAMATSGALEVKNRLAAEKSPYLLQHAANPVDW